MVVEWRIHLLLGAMPTQGDAEDTIQYRWGSATIDAGPAGESLTCSTTDVTENWDGDNDLIAIVGTDLAGYYGSISIKVPLNVLWNVTGTRRKQHCR